MKIIPTIVTIMIFLMPGVTYADGRTLVLSDLIGSWGPSRGWTDPRPSLQDMNSTEILLTVTAIGNATITRVSSEDGEITKEVHESDKQKQIGSLLWWNIPNSGYEGFHYELVLGGWVLSGDTKKVFGHLYLVRQDVGLFNGWPVYLQPIEKANK